jgi:hypothetical protein
MADPTQLSVVGCGYVNNNNKTVRFYILNRDRTKEIFFVNFSTPFMLWPGN